MARHRLQLTQADLATQLGVTPSMISKIETASMEPSPRIARRCIELLGVQAPPSKQTGTTVSPTRRNSGPPRQLALGLESGGTSRVPETSSWVDELLPIETLVEATSPPVYDWDIPHSIPSLGYLTHNYFRYYGKFPSVVARKLLRQYRPRSGYCVLDNFSGCGTTLVEALCEGVPSVGVDISPLGAFAGRVKTNLTVDESETRRLLQKLQEDRLVPGSDVAGPGEKDLRRWFFEATVVQLKSLKSGLLRLERSAERDFLVLAFLAIIRRVSRAHDGEVRPHVNADKTCRDVFRAYASKVEDMIGRMRQLEENVPNPPPSVTSLAADNRALSTDIDWRTLPPVGLVISHPPYLNCFDYAPVYRLEYLWAAGFQELGPVEYKVVRKSETRAWPATDQNIVDKYFDGLRAAYEEVSKIVSPGVRCCVVIGDCTIHRKVYPVLDQFTELMADTGFDLERTNLRSTHYGIGKYAYADRADYHGKEARKRDGILVFTRR